MSKYVTNVGTNYDAAMVENCYPTAILPKLGVRYRREPLYNVSGTILGGVAP